MHVAFSVLTATLAVAVFRSRPVMALYVAGAAGITLSTLTLSEHYALDALGGIALGLAAAAWWRRVPLDVGGATRPVPHPDERQGGGSAGTRRGGQSRAFDGDRVPEEGRKRR